MVNTLPCQGYLAASVRHLDELAAAAENLAIGVLMQRAGAAAWATLCQHWPTASRVQVLAGHGNNGGDGYVLARLAQAAGRSVTVLQVGDHSALSDDAAQAQRDCEAAGVSSIPYTAETRLEADVLIDALLGTGLRGEVTGSYQAAIQALNQATCPVLSLDIPSGLDADQGFVHGCVVKATATVTFIGVKLGLLTGWGPTYCGKLTYADLAVSPTIFSQQPADAVLFGAVPEHPCLGLRAAHTHKGSCGHVLVVGGDQGFVGAPLMAAMAALRVGAGRVSVATHPSHAALLAMRCPEIMSHGISDQSTLKNLLAAADVVVVGPGLGRSAWGETCLATVLASERPLVVDADGLNGLARQARQSAHWVLTPHPGEAARLLGCSVREINAARLDSLHRLRDEYGGVGVLKGTGTLILGEQGLALCHAGNPGMATAGMGDMLSGVIAALVGQGFALEEAARWGVCVHANAGDSAAQKKERGLIATDILPHLRVLVNPESRCN